MDEVKFILRTIGTRNISVLVKNIPGLIIANDSDVEGHNGMTNFINACRIAGDGPAVHLEDDIVLCGNFYERITAIINEHPDDVIQFFSMRKDDLTIGTRYIDGSRFMMNQCFYTPPGFSREIVEYYERGWKGIVKNPTGYDLMMADLMKEKHMKYLNIVPNLVNHKIQKSIINPRRPMKNRQSLTFEGPYDVED